MEYEQITITEVLATLEGNGQRPSHKGSGIGGKDVSFTLNATEQHAVALAEVHATLSAKDGDGANHSQKLQDPEKNYVLEPVVFGIGSKDSNAMKSDNPHSGIYKADTTRTLDLNGGNPSCNQGGMAVVEYQEVCGTLAASDYKFPQQQQVEEGKCIVEQNMDFENASFGGYKETDMAGTLKANGADFQGGETLHESNYLVRRLTPTETERLQGMPDMWCYGVAVKEPTDEELDFWIDAFETHRKVISGAQKPKTEKQARKAIGKELADSKIYAIQGNGIALPNAWFVLEGIARELNGEI